MKVRRSLPVTAGGEEGTRLLRHTHNRMARPVAEEKADVTEVDIPNAHPQHTGLVTYCNPVLP